MESVPDSAKYSFPGREEEILEYWKSIDAFHTQTKRREGSVSWVHPRSPRSRTISHRMHLLDPRSRSTSSTMAHRLPPVCPTTATSLPAPSRRVRAADGSLAAVPGVWSEALPVAVQDVVTRYATMNGHHVVRRFGWDCHGLPVEYEIDQKLGIKVREDVLNMGIGNYNEECRSIVMRYSKEWEKTVTRLGRWIDFENDYKTLNPEFMESVWWVFKQLADKGLIYRGFKARIVPHHGPFAERFLVPMGGRIPAGDALLDRVRHLPVQL